MSYMTAYESRLRSHVLGHLERDEALFAAPGRRPGVRQGRSDALGELVQAHVRTPRATGRA